MKTKLLFAISFLWGIMGFAQFGPQQVISTDTEKPYLSIPFDINNNGFIDILTASLETHELSWYPNLDGLGNFGPEIILNEIPTYYLSVEFIDLDNDGYPDIFYLGNNPRQVAWLKNIDNQGNYATEEVLLSAGSIMDMELFDVDEDGHLDLVVILQHNFESSIVWYRNLGNANFGAGQTIWDYDTYLLKLMVVDIDNDGKKDLVVVDDDYAPASIFWHKNLGNHNFGPPETIFQFDYFLTHKTEILAIKMADINNDGKDDFVFSTLDEPNDYRIYWLENINNQGHYANLRLIHQEQDNFALHDLDNDGDLDLLLWHRNFNRVWWKENQDGQGNFGGPRTITTEVDFPRDVRIADLNGDGFDDLLTASVQDNKLAWYKGELLNITENKADNFILFPNPTDGLLTIESTEEISKISIFNTLGQQVNFSLNNDQVDLSKAAAGVYFITLENSLGNVQKYKIVKK